MIEVLEKYCFRINNDYFYGFDEFGYELYQENFDYTFYLFKFTIYNQQEIDMWRKDAKLHTFTDKDKLLNFFESLKQ